MISNSRLLSLFSFLFFEPLLLPFPSLFMNPSLLLDHSKSEQISEIPLPKFFLKTCHVNQKRSSQKSKWPSVSHENLLVLTKQVSSLLTSPRKIKCAKTNSFNCLSCSTFIVLFTLFFKLSCYFTSWSSFRLIQIKGNDSPKLKNYYKNLTFLVFLYPGRITIAIFCSAHVQL